MDPKTADDFDPMRVPTVNELLNELNAADGKVEATRMQKAVDCFNETFWNALEKECKGDLAAKTRENAATKGASATGGERGRPAASRGYRAIRYLSRARSLAVRARGEGAEAAPRRVSSNERG